ncbi:MAG TPA: hypothetical protein EYG95_00220 [Campylobacterales bacterium]|nr:hypothetical protein [Campylobacterales bacterium]
MKEFKMIKYSLILALMVLFTGCGSDSVRDGSQGPTSSASARISTSGVGSSYYSTIDVEIEAVKRFNTEGVAVDIALSEDGRIAYIASGSAGLEVIDVSNPEHPYLIYSDDFPEYTNFVEVKEGVVYVGYVPEGLSSYYSMYAYDVNNPYYPYYIGSSEGKNGVAHSEETSGKYYYEVNREGLEIYQYNDARSVYKVGSYYLHDTAYALALHNNYVFIANGREGLTILKTNINGIVGHVN